MANVTDFASQPTDPVALPASLEQRLSALTRKHITIRERSLEYIEAGDPGACAAVLVHGIGSCASSWLNQFEALSDQYRLIAWNAPGFGDSAKLDTPQPHARDYASELESLCEKLGVERAHFVGQSMGALFVAALSDQNPALVRSITLINPARGYGHCEPEEREDMRSRRLSQMAQLGPIGNARARAPTQLSAKASAEALALVQWNLQQLNPIGYSHAVEMLAAAEFTDHASFTGPVQILSGAADGIVARANARHIASRYADSTLHSLSGLGHAAYAEGPDAVNRLLREFWAAN